MGFNEALERTLKWEGTYSDSKYDAGGKTMYGITEVVARQHNYWGPMRDLPLEKAKQIYKKSYWDNLSLDSVDDEFIQAMLFDISVNMGPRSAAKNLQRSLNALNRNERTWVDLIDDGIIGFKTLQAVNEVIESDKPFLYQMINGMKFMKYYLITVKNPEQEMNIRSWLRRITPVRKEDFFESK